MTKLQLIIVSAATVLFLVLYFGFDTKPEEQAKIEQERKMSAKVTGIEMLLQSARTELSADQATRIQWIEQQLNEAGSTDSMRIVLLKELSGSWYQLGRADIAGHYAEEVALAVEEDMAWSIAGTTYAAGLKLAKEEKIKQFCLDGTIRAFESAISLNPENVTHKVNLALSYVDHPPQDNPMKGVLMLVDLNRKNPDHPLVLLHLGRLAIQTGQYEKAVERLSKAVSIDPQNPKINCLLAQAYEQLGKAAEAAPYQQFCQQLSQ